MKLMYESQAQACEIYSDNKSIKSLWNLRIIAIKSEAKLAFPKNESDKTSCKCVCYGAYNINYKYNVHGLKTDIEWWILSNLNHKFSSPKLEAYPRPTASSRAHRHILPLCAFLKEQKHKGSCAHAFMSPI